MLDLQQLTAFKSEYLLGLDNHDPQGIGQSNYQIGSLELVKFFDWLEKRLPGTAPAGSVEFFVSTVDKAGDPLAGVEVIATSQAYCGNVKVMSDDNGIARFELSYGFYDFKAEHDVYGFASGTCTMNDHMLRAMRLVLD